MRFPIDVTNTGVVAVVVAVVVVNLVVAVVSPTQADAKVGN